MRLLPEQMRDRTKQFALRIVKLFRALPRSPEAQVMGKQLLRSGTSVAANYRAVCRARSSAEFLAKMGIVIEEADESVFWLGYWLNQGLWARNKWKTSSKRQMSCWRFSRRQPKLLAANLPHRFVLRMAQ